MHSVTFLLPHSCWDVDLTQHFSYAVGLDKCKRENDTSYKQHNQCWKMPNNSNGGMNYAVTFAIVPEPTHKS